jgi:metallo-beta-lactamase class B
MISRLLCAFATLLLAGTNVFAQRSGSQRAAWNKPFPPVHIIGNIYYVGASGVSSFLITTPAGHILLDGGLPETAPLIEKNIAALGFHMREVKYLLNSHAHFDHAGGLAALKEASHARLIASGSDTPTLTSGRQLSYGPGQSETRFPAVAVDRIIADGGTVSLGGSVLTAHLTPGHTKGCTTWSVPVAASGRTYQVVFYCSTTVAGNQLVNNPKYPDIVSDYENTFALLRKLPCDVFLASHPEFFHLSEKFRQMAQGGPNPFIDSREMPAFIDESERAFQRELQRQKSQFTARR